MLRSVLLPAAVLGLLLASPSPRAQTAAPSTISYQGVLTDAAGVPVPDGSYTIALALHTTATAGVATYAETHAVTTVGGVFAVEIGAGTPTTGTWANVPFNVSYWLATSVGGTTLTPRTRLLAAPYARSLTPGAQIGAPTAGSALTAAGIIETTAGGIRYPDGTTQTTASTGLALPYAGSASSTGYLIDVTNTNASGEGIQATTAGVIAIRGESAAGTGSGISGHATSTTGVSYGGFFRSASTSGQAVFAQATASTGTTYGVRASAFSPNGTGAYGVAPTTGIHGEATATSGTAYGARGESASTGGRGVFGEVTATTGTNYGVYGLSASSSGRGVYGRASSTTGTNYGVQGSAQGPTGIGVWGEGSSTTGANYGGYFRTLSPSGTGVHGFAMSTSGTSYGVVGRSAGASGRGVVGEAEASSGTTYGGYFTSASATGYGLYANNSTSSGYAAYFGDRVRVDNNMEFYDGSGDTGANIVFDVDEGGEAPSIKLLRGGVTVLELDAEHNGDSRVITQELEITGGSDLAEAFDVAPAAETAPAPGLVVSIDPSHPGRLAVSETPYDPLVAGVMSGAGGVEAGLIMGQRGSVADGEHAVALVGRVYVWTDASYGAVRPGDFLTTSATPGHAMRAGDAGRRTGAVLGKAMTALESGRGLVLVLVSLQ